MMTAIKPAFYWIISSIFLYCISTSSFAQSPYFPGRIWEQRTPASLGLQQAAVDSAIAFAIAHESKAPRDLELAHYQTFGREPFGDAVGPFKERGAPTGLIVYKGYMVASWGDPDRADMTFSVTKSFLSSVVGIAYDKGMISSLDDPVRQYLGPVWVYEPHFQPARMGQSNVLYPFESEHNRRVTWDHLLRQTSDWEGTLWDKPDWADRPSATPSDWLTRTRNPPGTVYEYNDTRVNLLALAALQVWRRPLPQVLKEYVMDPIQASSTWQWYGYQNSWVVLDGQAVQSVSGGGHWGGGLFINAYDQARFGYLTLRNGRWGNRQILSEKWLQLATTPTPAKTDYGFMNYFLNTGREMLPSAPESAFTHLGNGTNIVYVDREHDLVIVARWIERQALPGC